MGKIHNLGTLIQIDSGGIVKKIMHDDIGLKENLLPGFVFITMFEQSDQNKIRPFLDDLFENKTTFGWELNLLVKGNNTPFKFSGLTIEGNSFIMIQKEAQHGPKLIKNQDMEKESALPSVSQGFNDQLIYEELSLMNNELVNLKRELERKNAKLELINQALQEEINVRKIIETELKISETRYLSLFENSPIALWEVDFSYVKSVINDLQNQGVSDFETYFSEHPEGLRECINLIKVMNVNQATLELFAADGKDELINNVEDLFYDEKYNDFYKVMLKIANGENHFGLEFVCYTMNRKQLVINMDWSVLPGYENDLSKVIVSMIDITKRQQLEKSLQYESTHDTLTGLYNRRYFELTLENIQQTKQYPISILMMDVDGLKRINDTEGHNAGDELLRRVAQVLKNVFRREDMVARIGGDEFVAILPHTDSDTLAQVKQRLDLNLEMHNQNYAPKDALSISIGAVCGEADTPLSEILKQADQIMYQVKANKKNQSR